jgi:ketosteroid isomerase-like protein
MKAATNLEKIQLYLKCIEDGNWAPILELFTPDCVMEQLPNRIYPNGIRFGLSRMAEAFEKGRELFSSQKYEIKHHLVDGNSVAVEVLWMGTLSTSFGKLPAGSELRAYSAMFFEFKDGKIVRQRNYDCFEPW